jgi:two-component system, OmpR family, sensor histidine kinase BaeS
MRSLGLKIMLSFLLVALLSVGIVAYLANQSAQCSFADYIQADRPGQGMMGMHMKGMMGYAEQRFLRTLNSSLWHSALWTILVACGVAYLLTRNIIIPIRQLSTAAEKMRQGDYRQQVALTVKDEIGQLAQSFNTMAEKLAQNEEQRRHLLAAVAHELRTPLTVIQGNLEGMIDGVIPATQQQFQSLHEESLRLQRLVNDVRDLALSEVKQLYLYKSLTNVNDILAQSVQALAATADKSHVILMLQLPEDACYAEIDAHRIRQVVENLLTNAIRYSPPGETVEISCEKLPEHLKITVQDEGAGIDKQALPHIFEYFYRADPSRNRESGGMGLGLAIAKQIVEAHEGTISVDSVFGKGSIFTFTLRINMKEANGYEK